MSEQTATATIRTRIHLGRTIKEGWHYESTAELTASIDMPEAERARILGRELLNARALGEVERDERNQRDRGEVAG